MKKNNENIPVCNPPDYQTRKSNLIVPPGSVDCHTHVFNARYPMSPQRGYTPPNCSLDQMLRMHNRLGIERVVLTQPSVYGTDNSAILEAISSIPQQAKAVVAVNLSISDQQLATLEHKGVRGVRLNLDNSGGMPITLEEIPKLAERISPLGWHLEFLFAGSDLVELISLLRNLPVPISIGHFGYMPATEGTVYPPFQLLLELVREGNTWIKLSAPNRLGVGDCPPWNEVVPMARALIEAAPNRMLWATDWPHPNKYDNQPNDADLLEQLEKWAPDPALRHRILVDNPVNLYRF
jgi:predicted TIM-barrel fold metal-dependent hydrolase